MALTQISTGGIKDDAVTDAKLPANSVGNSEMKDDAVGVAELSATGTPSSSTFLRGDNSWVTPTDTNTQLAFANDGNNRVVTGDGSGGLNGEANLTFDGSKLGIGVTPKSWHSNNKAVIQGDGGYSILGRSDNFLGIYQNFYYDASDAGKHIETGEASAYFQHDGNHIFYTAASGSGDAAASLSEVLKLQADKNVKINDGDLVIGGTGHGINFAASQTNAAGMTSELLDSYEEGTWTPSIEFGGGSTGVTYSSYRSGSYIKIGNLVHLKFGFALTSNGSSEGSAKITGLPFSGTHSGYYHDAGATIMVNGGADSTGGHALVFLTESTKLGVRQGSKSDGNYDSTHTAFNDDTGLFGNIVYNTSA